MTSQQTNQSGSGSAWVKIATCPNGVVVETKIDDENGARNFARLRRSNNLFWTEDGKMYVYYAPTHWRPV